MEGAAGPEGGEEGGRGGGGGPERVGRRAEVAGEGARGRRSGLCARPGPPRYAGREPATAAMSARKASTSFSVVSKAVIHRTMDVVSFHTWNIHSRCSSAM